MKGDRRKTEAFTRMISVRYIRGLICLMAVAIMAQQALAGMEILLPTQQPLGFAGNMTFVVEDVDPVTGKAWLNLYGANGVLKSEILGCGDHFVYYGITRIDLTISRIYAGESTDLVSLNLNEGILLKNNANEGAQPAAPAQQAGNATEETAPVIPPVDTVPQEPAEDNTTTDTTIEDVTPATESDMPEEVVTQGDEEAAPEGDEADP